MNLKDKVFEKKNFNLYRGVVVNNKDPNNGGRVQVRIFELHGFNDGATPGNYPVYTGTPDTKYNIVNNNDLPWAEVIQNIDYIGFYPAPSDGSEEFAANIDGKGSKSGYKTITRSGKHSGTGYNRIIAEGAWVFCILENGNPNYPIVIGCVAADNEMHNNSGPMNTRIYDSITGHYEEWSDENGQIIFHHRSGTTITMTQDGNLYFNTVNIKKEYVNSDSFIHENANHYEFISIDKNVKIGNDENIVISNNLNRRIGSNETVNAGGNITMKASKIYLN